MTETDKEVFISEKDFRCPQCGIVTRFRGREFRDTDQECKFCSHKFVLKFLTEEQMIFNTEDKLQCMKCMNKIWGYEIIQGRCGKCGNSLDKFFKTTYISPPMIESHFPQ